jgi:protein-tyrosine phosphatase
MMVRNSNNLIQTAPNPGGTKEQISLFINSLYSNKKGFTAVHCTHGLNRTGFMICYYLLTKNKGMKVETGFLSFF